MNFLNRVENIISQTYLSGPVKGWELFVKQDGKNKYYLQVKGQGICPKTNKEEDWKGRKWRLSPHMVDSEILNTIYLALHTALTHELREHIHYKETRIFTPHLNYEMIVHVSKLVDIEQSRETGMEGE